MSRLAASFLRLSRRDLAGARRLLPDFPDLAAFLLQQAAEKLVKAELAATGMAPPRVHDIDALVRALPASHPRVQPLLGLVELTVYAVVGRYPEGEAVAASLDPEGLAQHADEIEALLNDISPE